MGPVPYQIRLGKSPFDPLLLFILKSCSLNSRRLEDVELTEIAGRLDPDKYVFLGVKLGIEMVRLSQVKHNNPGDIAGAMAKMLHMWRNDQSAPPGDVRKLLSDALKYVERSDLAETVYNGGE